MDKRLFIFIGVFMLIIFFALVIDRGMDEVGNDKVPGDDEMDGVGGVGGREENAEVDSVCFEGKDICFEVRVADSDVERARGLMYEESLLDDEGMLFVFDEVGKYSFWMKNTLIGLDIVWIDDDLRVVEIVSATPCVIEDCESYGGRVGAKYVLEVNGGSMEELGIGGGDKVVLTVNRKL